VALYVISIGVFGLLILCRLLISKDLDFYNFHHSRVGCTFFVRKTTLGLSECDPTRFLAPGSPFPNSRPRAGSWKPGRRSGACAI
jgi:hypothetical protein